NVLRDRRDEIARAEHLKVALEFSYSVPFRLEPVFPALVFDRPRNNEERVERIRRLPELPIGAPEWTKVGKVDRSLICHSDFFKLFTLANRVHLHIGGPTQMRIMMSMVFTAGSLVSALAFAEPSAFKFDCKAISLATNVTAEVNESLWLQDGKGRPSTTLIVANYWAKMDFHMNLAKRNGSRLILSLTHPVSSSAILAKIVAPLYLKGLDQVELRYDAPDGSDSIEVKCSVKPSTELPPSEK
ncbi:MAG: hypothetical protein EBY29_14235, partial [Planctomycetes bacterium]|nr:hypothetical protein [Planctomycetota bacterium]